MRKQVSFESKKDFILALMNGREFYLNKKEDGYCYYDKDTEGTPFKFSSHDKHIRPLEGVFELYNSLYEEVVWYKNIPPQGILCWVWNNDGDSKHTKMVVRTSGSVFYTGPGIGGCWQNAVPMTKEELLELCAEEQ